MFDPFERQKAILGDGPRLAPLAAAERSPEQQQLIERAKPPAEIQRQRGGDDTEWVEIMARNPGLFSAHMAFAMKIMAEGALIPRDRELAVLRLAWISGAPFEWGGHVVIAKACGVTAEEVARVIDGPDAAGWSRHDRALLLAGEELHADSMISDATWSDLSAGLDDRQLIELIMLIGHYKTVAYYQNTLRFRLPAGNEGLLAR